LNGTGETRLTKAVSRGRRVELTVDGVAVEAFEGESVAAALMAAGRRRLRVSGRRSEPRGMYCGIGLCFECTMIVDGQRVRTCVTPVRDGMRIGTPQDGRAPVEPGGAR
jgi:D-hydroxyproline dehydrogenase subunit gamma